MSHIICEIILYVSFQIAMIFLNLFGIVAAARTNPGDDYFVDMNSERLDQYYAPSIFIPIFVRNKAHALPYFLGGIENLNYPKTRIKIWFVTDHNEDGSLSLIQHWAKAWEVFEFSLIPYI
jgi:hypothetical protein